ncbi:unnamed protein product [Caenorhabditis angaria]|uniref:Uncharacterized protein n=1 Tax=Caenorhabditis angaria TaxID=860376 RepID=A0A9P1NCJ2_9PELO|nr:unnamed protein product [Caenorhabditis angaria]
MVKFIIHDGLLKPIKDNISQTPKNTLQLKEPWAPKNLAVTPNLDDVKFNLDIVHDDLFKPIKDNISKTPKTPWSSRSRGLQRNWLSHQTKQNY